MRNALGVLLDDRTVRFIVTGVGAALLLASLTYAVLALRLPPFSGTLAAYSVTVVVSYSVQRGWTFGGQHRHGDAFPRYAAAQIACAVLTAGLVRMGARLGCADAPLSLATTFVGSAISYCLSRFWVFPARTH